MSGKVKLSPAQEAFALSLHEKHDDFEGWYSCEAHEWRTATAMADRGLVEIYQRGNERPRYFDARLTEAGRQLLQENDNDRA